MAIRRVPARRSQPWPGSSTETLSAVFEADERTTVIRLVGSLRCATAPFLREAVDAALARRPTTVVLDLADVTADDELGLWVLPAMAGDAGRRGISLVVGAPHRALRVRLRCLGGHPLEIIDVRAPRPQ
jgi:anti-sigma B factor antagonist